MAKKIVTLETQSVAFDVDGAIHAFDLSKVSPEMVIQLALHGASQKIGDSYAGAAKAIEGTEMTEAEYVVDCVTSGIEQLYNNDWSIRTGAGAGPRITDLAKALAEAYKVTEDEAAERVAGLDADQKKGVRAHPAISPILDRIRAERAAEKAAKSAETATDSELPDLF